ncbi:hypothetical protein [Bradyrhizobium sp.]|uniref:hypothetical protein n=1 Tax=Bradyrhizobium sp. TaxID=376 RepID=UPI0025C1B1D8|nr:hypothetical protein [Bradyrhizobium sp.]MBV8918292.1 hypothetical protein [Bradyrhizobium sp.]
MAVAPAILMLMLTAGIEEQSRAPKHFERNGHSFHHRRGGMQAHDRFPLKLPRGGAMKNFR